MGSRGLLPRPVAIACLLRGETARVASFYRFFNQQNVMPSRGAGAERP